MNWLKKVGQWFRGRSKYEVLERVSFIREAKANDDNDPEKLSLIDIKAAIAAQSIPIGELYSRQDLAANREVIELIHTAENKARGGLEKEIVILKKSSEELQSFKDKADVGNLVEKCKVLADKDASTVSYIRKRMSSGRGVHFEKGLTENERQDKVNEAITEELALMKTLGMTFTKTKKDGSPNIKDNFDEDPQNINNKDMTESENNDLIPNDEK